MNLDMPGLLVGAGVTFSVLSIIGLLIEDWWSQNCPGSPPPGWLKPFLLCSSIIGFIIILLGGAGTRGIPDRPPSLPRPPGGDDQTGLDSEIDRHITRTEEDIVDVGEEIAAATDAGIDSLAADMFDPGSS